MFQTIKNAWRTPELRSKLLFTLLIVVLYRIGSNIPVPFLDPDLMEVFATQTSGSLLGYMNWISGGALAQGTLFALNVSPYITASIVIQLLTIAIPALERKSKEGEEGRKFISALTRWVTVGLALITSYGYMKLLDRGVDSGSGSYVSMLVDGTNIFGKIVIVGSFCAGAALIMWLAERINEKGIGNGISIILFVNIISQGTSLVQQIWGMTFTGGGFNGFSVKGLILSVLAIVALLGMTLLIIWFTESERKIPVQYAKRQVGRKMYGGQSSNLPLKMNMAGVMPIIFASSITSIPQTIAGFISNSDNWFRKFVTNWFNMTTWLYLVVTLVLIFLFSYFYILISFNPVEVSNNIKNQGGAIPGIRPGKPTAEYITRILNRVTTLGAIFLAVVAGAPMLVNVIVHAINSTSSFTAAFSGNSLLIVVGVALETFRALESQLAMRNYKGFLD